MKSCKWLVIVGFSAQVNVLQEYGVAIFNSPYEEGTIITDQV